MQRGRKTDVSMKKLHKNIQAIPPQQSPHINFLANERLKTRMLTIELNNNNNARPESKSCNAKVSSSWVTITSHSTVTHHPHLLMSDVHSCVAKGK